jgi:phosphopantothenoylcysteine decarboxylase/phosphopantothenate--cysteine ligase
MHPSLEISCTLSRKLLGRKVVLGVTGSIAAVETVKLARLLIRHGAQVIPVMTDAATRIIHPDALEFATGRHPITKLTGAVEHVAFLGKTSDHADLLLIAPATANTIGKIAYGIDDTPVTTMATTALGSGIPVLIIPAMHGSMYDHKIVLENIEKLKSIGVHFMDPRLEERVAKIPSVEDMVDVVLALLGPKDLDGKRVLVITGPTMEPIDDMRVISNKSSGATGLAIAKEAFYRGAEVILWHSANIEPPKWASKSHSFKSTSDLFALTKKLRRADVILVPAAISDFSVKGGPAKGKVPSDKALTLALEPTPKIILGLASKCKVLVGFKAESKISHEGLLLKARDRMKNSKATLFVANDLARVTHDETEVLILDKKGGMIEAKGPKDKVAADIFDQVVKWL